MPPFFRVSRVLLAAAAIAAGCRSGSRPDIADILDGGLSTGPCADVSVCTPDTNNGVCQHTCTPDPGPRLVTCNDAEQLLDFKSIWTFDEPSTLGNARAMYSYTDNSTVIRTFRAINNQTGLYEPKTWQPPTAKMPRCSDRPSADNHAIHIQGGPFLSWGGGVGMGMKNYKGVTSTAATIQHAMIDVSGYEGISFWARRGPDSQAGFRVLVGDKYTDDDISYIMYRDDPMQKTQKRYCERVRECGCLNHKSCVAVHLDRAVQPDGTLGEVQNKLIPAACAPTKDHLGTSQVMKFCGTPEAISGAESSSQGGSSCNTCVETKCDERWPAFPDDCGEVSGGCANKTNPAGTDRQYYGKPCSPYTMRSGIFGYWCFDPAAGERPAEPTEQCGDHWTRVVNLSTEWQFYTVPFSAMAQQGWAKRSAGLDLSSVSVVRFTWDGGWVDFWIDDVSFYKHKPQ